MKTHLFSDLNLSRRLEKAEAHANSKFVEARARLFPESGAERAKVAGAYAMFDGIDSPITQTFGLGMFESVSDTEMEELENFFFSRGAEVFHEVSPLAGLPLVELLSSRGYRPIEFSSVMYRRLLRDEKARPRINPEMHDRPINDTEGPVWADATVRGWSEFPKVTDYLASIGPICTQREDSVSFLVELDNCPVAAGAMTIFGGVGLLAGACTVPEARRQGAQLALLDYRLRYANQQGCDVAMMCALPGSPSQRNAERNGFRVAYTRTKWHIARKSRHRSVCVLPVGARKLWGRPQGRTSLGGWTMTANCGKVRVFRKPLFNRSGPLKHGADNDKHNYSRRSYPYSKYNPRPGNGRCSEGQLWPSGNATRNGRCRCRSLPEIPQALSHGSEVGGP